MDIKIVITADNEVRVAVPGGATFEQAKAAIQGLLAELGAEGLPIVLDGEIEQHRHGPDEVRTHGHTHAHR